MQTFLPYPDFRASAEALDDKRLGKQRVETIQVVRGLTVPDYGWRHHPAVRMWRGCLEGLGRYGLEICRAWVERGFADTCADTIRGDLAAAGLTLIRSQQELADSGELPYWLGEEDFHRRHRSKLLQKDPEFYRSRFDEPTDLDYWWPDGRMSH